MNLYQSLFEEEPKTFSIPDINETIKFYSSKEGQKILLYSMQAQDRYDKAQFEEALILINEAIRLDHKNSAFYLVKGDILNGLLKYEQALNSYQSALELGSMNFLMLGKIGDLFLIGKKYDKAILGYLAAIDTIEDVNNKYPPNDIINLKKIDSDGIEFKAKYFLNIGLAYSEIGTKEALKKGIEFCCKALEIHFHYSKPRMALAIIYNKIHNLINDPNYDGHFLDKAVSWVQQAAQLEKIDPIELMKTLFPQNLKKGD